jgi:hypothetical protein
MATIARRTTKPAAKKAAQKIVLKRDAFGRFATKNTLKPKSKKK